MFRAVDDAAAAPAIAAAPTIRTLAKVAGVSIATVSLALRNHPRIRLSERERIQRIAAEAGYKTNAVVAHLLARVRASKTSTYQSTLAVFHCAQTRADVEHRTSREWAKACAARATQLGYALDHFSLYKLGFSPERAARILDARGIRGLIVTGPFHGKPIPPEFDVLWERSCPVVLGERPVRPALSCVLNNQFSTTALAMEELLRLGYRRIGLCVHPDFEEALEYRFHGGFYAVQCRQPRRDHVPVFDFRPDASGRFMRWVKAHRPDAILTLHDEVRAWLRAMGRNAPRDIGLAHLDKPSDGEAWACMNQNNQEIGLAAVDMVVGQLHRNEFGAPPFQKCVFIGSTWLPGPTVRQVGKEAPPPTRKAASARE